MSAPSVSEPKSQPPRRKSPQKRSSIRWLASCSKRPKQTGASVDESVVRYTALVQQRIAAAIRTPLKDRIIYRNETAVRAFWDQDYDAVVQVLGTHSQYPGRSIAVREGDLDWLDDLPFDKPFEPGGERLLLGLGAQDDDDDDDYWIAHPLAHGADSLYRYESGDTLTLGLPDGRQLQTIQLDVLPREADVHRITGTLWIEPESGALVRAVYRLSRQFDVMRDVPEVQQEDERRSFRYVPGLFKPWTFDLTMVAVDYSLWNFEVWLPRSMRMEGEVGAGILKMPVSMDLSYRIESVTTQSDLARPETAEQAGLVERHFESRGRSHGLHRPAVVGGGWDRVRSGPGGVCARAKFVHDRSRGTEHGRHQPPSSAPDLGRRSGLSIGRPDRGLCEHSGRPTSTEDSRHTLVGELGLGPTRSPPLQPGGGAGSGGAGSRRVSVGRTRSTPAAFLDSPISSPRRG